jgi:NADH-quinone oxidoreductase subunit J
LAIVVSLVLIAAFNASEFVTKQAELPADTVKGIGVLLLTDYLIAFEAASALLLIAIVGAALIARNKKQISG